MDGMSLTGELFNHPSPLQLGRGQVLGVIYPEMAWVQLFTALFVGILTAFALQLVFTNFGIALGLSLMGTRRNAGDEEPDVKGNTSRSRSPFGVIAGFGILLTVNSVLLVAAFLGTRFSQINDPISGAITGIAIWAAYCLLLVWISSRAVGSVVGSLLDITTGGFRRLIGAIAAVFTAPPEDPVTEEQVLATVRQEMQAALQSLNLSALIQEQVKAALPSSLQGSVSEDNGSSQATQVSQAASIDFSDAVETYLYEAKPKSLTPKRMERKLQKMLASLQEEPAALEPMPSFDRAGLGEILDYRDDLSEKQKNRVLDRLEEIWSQFAEEYPSNLPEDQMAESEQDSSNRPAIPVEVLQTISDAALKQVMANLPALLQHIKTVLPHISFSSASGITPIILAAVLGQIQDGMEQSVGSSALTPEQVKHTLEAWAGQSQSSVSKLNHALETQLGQWRDRTFTQVEMIQQGTQGRLAAWKQQAQQRVDETRKVAGMAAWWLFMTTFTGALSAALAGAIAAGWDVVHLVLLLPTS